MALVETTYSSPNYDARDGKAVRLIVLHATVGSLQSALSWLCNPQSKASTHYLISKTGRVLRLVPESMRAWHAGRAKWQDETDVNAISIGIELENDNSGNDRYPEAQMRSLTDLVVDLMQRYHLNRDEITRHLDVAVPAGRKTDPAGFPLDAWRAMLPTSAPRYRARYRCAVYERSEGTGPVWGVLEKGEVLSIDTTYPAKTGHDTLGRGFLRMEDLEPA